MEYKDSSIGVGACMEVTVRQTPNQGHLN